MTTQNTIFNYTGSLYGSGLLTGHKAIRKAVELIMEGNIVCLQGYSRPDKQDSTKVELINTSFFGMAEIDGNQCVRTNGNKDIEGNNSHSLIPSWESYDTQDIAIRLTMYVYRCYPVNPTDIVLITDEKYFN